MLRSKLRSLFYWSCLIWLEIFAFRRADCAKV